MRVARILAAACGALAVLRGALGCAGFIGVPDLTFDPTASEGAPDAAAEPSAAPKLVASTVTRGTAPSTVTISPPANVAPGDLLVAVADLVDPVVPPGWIEIGRTSTPEPLWLGTHVLGPTETPATTFLFTSTAAAVPQVIVAAYRGARTALPLTPAVVTRTNASLVDASDLQVTPPGFITRGISIPHFAFSLPSDKGFPSVPGLRRIEATPDLALYAGGALKDNTTVPGPTLSFTATGGRFGAVASASFAVVGP